MLVVRLVGAVVNAVQIVVTAIFMAVILFALVAQAVFFGLTAINWLRQTRQKGAA